MKNNHLALGGLFAALHLLFIVLSKVLVGSEFILVVFLPLLSTMYALKFNIKESAMFFIATFLLCLIFEPICACVYILPALLSGSVYGMARKKKAKEMTLLYLSSLTHALTVSISFWFICLMFKGIDLFNIFSLFIHKQGSEFYVCVYLILLLLGVIEAFVVHVICNEELKKVGYDEVESENKTPMWIDICLIISIVMCVGLSFVDKLWFCYCLPFLVAFTIPSIIEFVVENKKKWIYFLVGIMAIVNLYLLNYVDPLFYPGLMIGVTLPILLEKSIRVLYTNLSKYSNKTKNRIQ